MNTWKAAAPLLLALGLTACGQQPPVLVALGPAQNVPAANTMLGEACDGHHPTASVHLAGDSLLNMTVQIDEIARGGVQPFAQGAVPVDFASQSLARPVFLRGVSTVSCTGVAVRTKLRNDYAYQGRIFLDYVLELAPNAPTEAERPAAPSLVKGSFEVVQGHGADEARFAAGGHTLVAHIQATPGTGWHQLEVERVARAADELAYPTYARPLPDELPDRTLEDVTNPAYSNGSSNPLMRMHDDRTNGMLPGNISPSFTR